MAAKFTINGVTFALGSPLPTITPWPPEKGSFWYNRLDSFSQTLNEVRNASGVKGLREVRLVEEKFPNLAVYGSGKIVIDSAFLREKDPVVSPHSLKSIIFHETGHLHYDDHKSQLAILYATGPYIVLERLQDFYTKHPDEFYREVIKQFGSIKKFITTYETLLDGHLG